MKLNTHHVVLRHKHATAVLELPPSYYVLPFSNTIHYLLTKFKRKQHILKRCTYS